MTWDCTRATYEDLLLGAHLSREIEDLEQRQDRTPPPILLLTPAQQRLLLGRLRELLARRVVMRREPDDERNAPRDMCCCDTPGPHPYGRQLSRRLWPLDCPLHPRRDVPND